MKYSRRIITLSLSVIFCLLSIQLPATRTRAGANVLASTGKAFAGRAVRGAPSPDTLLPKVSDFDGDGKSDLALFQPPFIWFWKTDVGPLCTWGVNCKVYFYDLANSSTADILVPGDYDDNNIFPRRTNLAFRRPTGVYEYANDPLLPAVGGTPTSPTTLMPWQLPNDRPVSGDHDGNGRADFTVVRDNCPIAGKLCWYVSDPASGLLLTAVALGDVGDILVPGDYNGDGMTDLVVFHTTGTNAGMWEWLESPGFTVLHQIQWGVGTDTPVLGNFDNDGKDDFAVVRDSGGVTNWYILKSLTNTIQVVMFGAASDIPVPATYDNDNITDIAVYRPSTGDWYIAGSMVGIVHENYLSPNPAFVPVAAAYVKCPTLNQICP